MAPLWPGRTPTPTSRAALLALSALGWTVVLAPPPGPKVVAAVAPHTSNADFWPGILLATAVRLPVRFLAKRELFTFPVGVVMRALGGLPVDRQRAGGNVVDAVVAIIDREPELVLAVAPEGTRARGEYWKTGFYYMALEAGVPIGVTVLDWGRRRVGIVGYVQPTGDLHADFAHIRALLEGVRGHTPGQETPAYPRPVQDGGPSRL
ncbi:1-acyl-sn-glycerol-3-phosphate acyltransferase [Deinococcus metalli]|uniref:1-acyl-sn-glycerol-3-phosphate acyltransferase n=1 Tax=Deinococcus metalli TaxID=1141878 RepID=A0A7W8KIY1_9DEIO|nr:1-acyl-sn-glycerol-3-phosphate acyltransferase [Deinococcus metalli]MBB5379059.1 1-acyl-sn-glycerol-3-phosphate acyltransferase [Deinococcus metalli]GHF63947.1 glycerol acyltransferase [Deinococcus metalli]